MAILEAYFDESYGSGGPLCVAGYVFNKTNARALDKEWRGMLRRWKLPYFRMSACAHYAPPFKDVLRKDQCVEVEKQAIALTSGYCFGFDAAVLDAAFVSFTQQKKLDASGSFEVLYDEGRLRGLMRQYADNALAAVDKLVEPPALRKQTVEAMQHIGVNLMFAIIFTALFFKHPSYYSEKEYRYLMMTLPDNTISGRMTRPGRGGGMVGFFELDWKSQHGHALTTIRIGPAKQEAEGRRIVAEALSSTGLSPEIVMSAIPPIRN